MFRKSLIVFFCSILLSCASYEDNRDILDKGFTFKSDKDLAVIYLLRDFPTSEPLSLEFYMMMVIDSDSRNKLDDALDALGETSKPAGIPYNVFRFEEAGFARLEMPPGQYNMYTYFPLATQSEKVQSQETQTFNSGTVYFYNIAPQPNGPFSSTIYYLEKISQDEADLKIRSSDLKMVEFQPAF